MSKIRFLLAICVVQVCWTKPIFANDFYRPLNNPYLYEVTSPDGKFVSYILGTYHVGFGLSELPDWVLDFHSNTSHHFYERSATHPSRVAIYRQQFEKPEISRPDTNSYNDQKLLIEQGIDQRIAPFVPLYPIISCNIFAHFVRYDFGMPYKRLDAELHERSIEQSKVIGILDSQEILAKARMADAETGQAKEEVCRAIEKLESGELGNLTRSATNQMMLDEESYQRGSESEAISDFEMKPSLNYRNKRWMEKLLPVLIANESFISVGLNHLWGDEGLIELFKQKGFQIRRYPPEGT